MNVPYDIPVIELLHQTPAQHNNSSHYKTLDFGTAVTAPATTTTTTTGMNPVFCNVLPFFALFCKVFLFKILKNRKEAWAEE